MAASEPLILALDLGGTRFRVALVDPSGAVLRRASAPTNTHEGLRRTVERIKASIGEALASAAPGAVVGMGVAVASPVRWPEGLLLTPPNLPQWADVPLKELWERETGLPTWVGNDATLAALAEHRLGAGRGFDHLVYITVSTGIGGGIVAGGRLIWGEGGLAGEVGHMALDPQGPLCKCGRRGCLEAFASGPAISEQAVARLTQGAPSAIARIVEGDLSQVTAETVEAAARLGDPLARDVMLQAASALGLGIANLIMVLNPQAIVIGGGVARGAWDLIEGPVQAVLRERVVPYFRQEVAVLPAALADDGGLIGAALMVRDALSD